MGCNIVKVTCKNTVTNYSLTTEHLLMEKVFEIFKCSICAEKMLE